MLAHKASVSARSWPLWTAAHAKLERSAEGSTFLETGLPHASFNFTRIPYTLRFNGKAGLSSIRLADSVPLPSAYPRPQDNTSDSGLH